MTGYSQILRNPRMVLQKLMEISQLAARKVVLTMPR